MSGKWTIVSVVAVLMSASLLIAADEGAAPAAQPEAHHRAARLTKPWSEISSLTDEQKTQIEEIHGKALDKEKEIRAKEQADIEALLTDAQKAELKSAAEKTATDRKEHAGGKKKDGAAGPTTSPAE
jgi:Spy/CpxP family protein refolding chaperone